MGVAYATPSIAPDAATQKLGAYLRMVLIIHILHAIAQFFATSFISGIFNLLFCVYGWAAVRDNSGYRPMWLRCYYWWCAWSIAFDVLFIILFYTGVWTVRSAVAFQVVTFVGFAVYAAGWWLGGEIFKRLLRAAQDAFAAGGMGVGLPAVATAYPVQGARAYPAPQSASGEPGGGVVQAIPVAGGPMGVQETREFRGESHTMGAYGGKGSSHV